MGSRALKLGRLHGIDIGMDLGVIPLLGLLSWLLATSVLPAWAPGHIALTYWTVAVVIAVLFVASLLVHELAHSLVAGRFGIGVKGIALWLFGGISEFETEPQTPGAAFTVSVAGPLASLGFGAVSFAASYAIHAAGGPPIYVAALEWLAIVNGFLGVFNLLPAVPLDGGHIVVAIVWKLRHDKLKGGIAAAVAGRFLGMAIAGLGLFEISRSGSWFGVWNIGIGLMLHQSAKVQERFLRLEAVLGETTVAEVMDSAPISATAMATISQAVETVTGAGKQSALPILNWSGHVIAVVEMSDLYSVPRNHWEDTTALASVRGDPSFVVAEPTEKVADLLMRMSRLRRRHAAVVEDGELIGLVGPEQIIDRERGSKGESPG